MAQEVTVLESVKRPQVLPQDVSTSHDFLGQDTQVFQAHEKEGSSRVLLFFLCRKQLVFILKAYSILFNRSKTKYGNHIEYDKA
jgi:hypothetical protein